MRRSLLAIQLLVAAASAVNVIAFRLQNLLTPQSTELDDVSVAALATIAALSGGMFLLWRYARVAVGMRVTLSVAVVALTVLSGFAPQFIESRRQAAVTAEQLADEQRADENFAREFRQWADDIDRRPAAARPFAPEQAWSFVDFVIRVGLRGGGPDDRSAEALLLLRKALAAKLIDVNGPVQGQRLSDTSPRPLFLQFYQERIEPLRSASAIRAHDWEIMQLLASNGADLALPDAAPLVADLAKTPVPGAGRFIGLR